MRAEQAAAHCAALARALRSLRLNLQFPDWRAVAHHLEATAVLPPGAELRLDEHGGWPHPDEWLRVRVDHELAPRQRARLAPLVSAGDPPSASLDAYFAQLQAVTPLPSRSPVRAALVDRDDQALRYEIVLDRLDLAAPAFVRWTLRLVEPGPDPARFDIDALEARAQASFTRRLAALALQPAAAALALLDAEADLDVDELVRGEIGPVLPGPDGPTVTASLTRASRSLRRTSIDDPLSTGMLAPSEKLPFGLSHHRKWAVPATRIDARRSWLEARGSRNLVYAYRP